LPDAAPANRRSKRRKCCPTRTCSRSTSSLSSLAYARRKTRALGLTNIAYAQADILRLDTIGRTFDLIASTGVLHHLADPLAGLRVLIKLLRPRGLMHLGFYSEAGRQPMIAARRFIAQRGYRGTAADIQRCRQELMSQKPADLPDLAELDDFFSTSACRDLLFHVAERRMTLPEIQAFLAAEGPVLVGFQVEPHVSTRYRQTFPADATMTNLANWHAPTRRMSDCKRTASSPIAPMQVVQCGFCIQN
jgi:SAM-dependent methyltransferase